MKTFANLVGLIVVGLIILGLAKKPDALKAFFSGINGTLGLLTK